MGGSYGLDMNTKGVTHRIDNIIRRIISKLNLPFSVVAYYSYVSVLDVIRVDHFVFSISVD